MEKRDLDVGLLRELLDYDPDTGVLTWKSRNELSPHWTVRGARFFNNKFAGCEAGFLKKVKNRNYTRREIKFFDGRNYLAHRVAWAWMTGEWPSDMIDHLDQNPLNNKWNNLRAASNAINQQNATRRRDNTSGVTGISWVARSKKWKVDTQFNNERRYAMCDTLLDAVAIRFSHLRECGFSVNHGRSRDVA